LDLVYMSEEDREAHIKNVGFDPSEWQHYREIYADNFQEFWGDGSDHAASWDYEPVYNQCEEAWRCSAEVQKRAHAHSLAVRDRLLERLVQAYEGDSSELQDAIEEASDLLGVQDY